MTKESLAIALTIIMTVIISGILVVEKPQIDRAIKKSKTAYQSYINNN